MAALVTDAERHPEVAEFANQTKLVTGRGKFEQASANLAYMRRHTQAQPIFDRIGADNAAIIYSSGSTGRPKGILMDIVNSSMAPTSSPTSSAPTRTIASVV